MIIDLKNSMEGLEDKIKNENRNQKTKRKEILSIFKAKEFFFLIKSHTTHPLFLHSLFKKSGE